VSPSLGAWQIEESTIKMFVEPMASLAVNAIQVSWHPHPGT